MSIILAIDTSNNHCSVALNRDGDIQSAICTQARQHAKRLMPMIDEVLQVNALSLNELDAIAFVNGPGSFTGLRIGAGVAQGLAFGTTLPVVAVSTLAVMAQKAAQQVEAEYFAVAMHAREDEFYFGVYHNKAADMSLLGKEQVCSSGQVEVTQEIALERCCAVGDGWQKSERLSKIAATFAQRLFDCDADASNASVLARRRLSNGDFCEPQFALPVYLKEQMDY